MCLTGKFNIMMHAVLYFTISSGSYHNYTREE